MSETRKVGQQSREGAEQMRDAGKAAIDAGTRASKDAVRSAEEVFERAADEARAIGAGMADTMARSAEAAADISQRALEQGSNVLWLGMRTAAGVNGRFADTSYDRSSRVLDATARALDVYHEAAQSSAEKVQALLASAAQLGRGVQEMQAAYLQLLDRTLKNASRKPQDLLRAKSFEEFAQIQRDLYIEAVNYALDATSTLLQIAGRVAQEAVPPPQGRAVIVPAR